MRELWEVHRDVRVPEGTDLLSHTKDFAPSALARSSTGLLAGVWRGGRAVLGLLSLPPERKGDAKGVWDTSMP